MYATFSAAGPQNDVLVADFGAQPWRSQALPTLLALFFDADADTDVWIYLAPGAGAAEFDRITLVRATATRHQARSCFPIWVPSIGAVPYEMRIETSAGNARVRYEWSNGVV